MAWFKVDDGFYTSRKVLSIPRSRRLAALGLWTACGSWSMRELTDGHVPRYVVEELGGGDTEVNDLLTAKLWIEGKDGYKFWDFEDYQPSAAKVKSDRKSTSEMRSAAGRKGAQNRWQKMAKNNGKAEGARDHDLESGVLPSSKPFKESTTVTDNIAAWQSDGKADGKAMGPTQPNQQKDKLFAQPSSDKTSRNVVIPKSWKPNSNAIEFAAANSINVDHEAEQFKNHSEATGRKMKNWDAAFRVWLGNSVKWKKPAQIKATTDDWMNS